MTRASLISRCKQISIEGRTGRNCSQVPMDPQAKSGGEDEGAHWTILTRFAFRFAFTYISLFFLSLIPFPLLDRVIPWVGRHILRLSKNITVFTNGSGDTTYNYVITFSCLLLATIATILWSYLDAGRSNYHKLHQWLRFLVRLLLVLAMSLYGWDKVFLSQMPAPSLSTLLEPFGQASPFNLLWTFMGASRTYEVFAGLAEVFVAVLLILPRLTTLGALISVGVLSNVFMLNMSYDVPVKIVSFHLLLLAVFLVVPDIQRLARFFLLNRPVGPAVHPPLSRRRWIRQSALIVLGLAGMTGFCLGLYVANHRTKTRNLAKKLPLYGAWSVDDLAMDGIAWRTLPTDNGRWRRLIFEDLDGIAIQFMDGSLKYLNMNFDSMKNMFSLSDDDDPNWKAQFVFETLGQQRASLQGSVNGNRVDAKLHRIDTSSFPLTSRGFHWINEHPFWR
jgi:uncharacterized membrane protein YphA (DoxX/SURF4 family)